MRSSRSVVILLLIVPLNTGVTVKASVSLSSVPSSSVTVTSVGTATLWGV